MRYLIIALVVLGLAAPAAHTQPFRGGGKQMKEKLNLTDEQAETLKDIRTKTAKQMIDITSSIKKKGIDLRTLMTDDSPDRNAVKTLMADIGTLKVERNMLMFDTRQAVQKVLTPEQQKTLKELRSKGKQNMKSRMRKHMRNKRPDMGDGPMGDEPGGPPMGFLEGDMDEPGF